MNWFSVIDRRLVKSFFHLATSLVVSKVFLLVAIAYGARMLGPTQWGVFSYAFTVLFAMHLLGDFGFHTLIMREAAKGSLTNIVFSKVIALRFYLGIVSFVLALFFIDISHRNDGVLPVLGVLGLSMLLRPMYASVRSLTQGLEQAQWTTVLDAVLYGVFLLLIVIGLGLFPHATYVPSFAWLVGVACSATVARVIYRKSRLFLNQEDCTISTFFGILRMAAPFLMINVVVVMFHRVDMLMLERFRGYEEVGYYSAAYQIFDAVALLPGIMTTVLFPRMVSQKHMLGLNETHRILWVVAGLSLLVATCATMISHFITMIVFGGIYEPAVALVKALLLGIPFMAATGILAHVLFSKNRPGISSFATGISLLANIALNWVYIPKYGMVAAAWVTTITLVFNSIVHFLIVRQVSRYS